jgi:hypothetical protein
MASDPTFYQRATASAPPPNMAAGASGYFSAPSAELDPHLFNGDHLLPEVREDIKGAIFTFLTRDMGLTDLHRWLHLWITGSAISFQWNADRGEGDLDVMVGVKFVEFQRYNPTFQGMGPQEFAALLTDKMKELLWPKTAHMPFDGKPFEVTYYLNAGTEDDVRVIRPYAAYDLLQDVWVIRPPKLPHDPRTLYPKDWFERTERDAQRAREITKNYQSRLKDLNSAAPQSPGWHNAGAALNLITAQAHALFSDLHTGRQAAFSVWGQGYKDWNNFRWQYGKQTGTVQAMHAIMQAGEDAQKAEETKLYGAPIDPAEVALRRAALIHRNTGI